MLAIIALFFAVCAHAQTVDDIINKYIDAVGGREAISKIKSLHIEGEAYVKGDTVSSDKGIARSSGIVNLIVGKGWKSESTDFNGIKNIQCVTDTGGWSVTSIPGFPMPTATVMSKDTYNAFKVNLQVGGLLMNYVENGCKAELVGKETMDSISVYKIKLTKSSNESDFYINANTYYLIKTELGAEKTPNLATIINTNYQKTDIGYMIPFIVTISMPNGGNATQTITKVVVNPVIDPKIFERPE